MKKVGSKNPKSGSKKKPTLLQKGSWVKFAIRTAGSTTRGEGRVVALVPKEAERGARRLTIKDRAGRLWHPYPSQIVR